MRDRLPAGRGFLPLPFIEACHPSARSQGNILENRPFDLDPTGSRLTGLGLRHSAVQQFAKQRDIRMIQLCPAASIAFDPVPLGDYAGAMLKTRSRPMTRHDYQVLPDGGPRWQLVDGEFHMAPAPNRYHQDISRNLEYILLRYLDGIVVDRSRYAAA